LGQDYTIAIDETINKTLTKAMIPRSQHASFIKLLRQLVIACNLQAISS